MKRLFKLATITLLFIALAVPALAKGGNGKGKESHDVCWMQGTAKVKAKFIKTSSGLVQQFRYSPDDKHLIFKPMTKFDEPDEGNWFAWRYYEQYGECDPLEGGTLNDVFDLERYWVQIINQ